MRRLLASLAMCLVTFFAFAGTGSAQTWPAKPITIVVPFAPGSGTDSITRIIAQYLQVALGQSVVVENKVGASGVLAATLRRARGARRLHAADGDQLHALRQPVSVQESRLRPREGFRAGRAHRLLRVHAGRQQGRAGEDAAGARRLREGQSRQAHLCERQHHRDRRGRDVQAAKPASTSCMCPTRARRRRSTTCSAAASR